MQLTCPQCRRPVAAKDVNIPLGSGRCLACRSDFNLAPQLGEVLPSPHPKSPIAAPQHWRIGDYGTNLSIRWRWYRHVAWLLLIPIVFGLFWTTTWNSIVIPFFLGQGEIQWGL